MRTDLKVRSQEKVEGKNATLNTEERGVNGVRKSLHPLQEAAGDKENLVGGGRIKQMPTVKDKPAVKEKSNLINDASKQAKKPVKSAKEILIEDLTSEAGPSKEYWEVIAERRRIALEEALKENEELREKIAALEEENAQCKVVIEETQHLVETLTEMLNEENEEEKSKEDTNNE